MQQTQIARYPYPDYLDPPNGGDQTRQLGEAVERDVVLKFADAAARDALITAPQPGMLALLTAGASPVLTTFTTGAWRTYFPPIPAPVWQPLPLVNGFVPYDPNPGINRWAPPSMCKDAFGLVRLRGLARGVPTAANVAAQLPVGFRPPFSVGYLSFYTAKYLAVRVNTGGGAYWDVPDVPAAGAYAELCFDGISFEGV